MRNLYFAISICMLAVLFSSCEDEQESMTVNFKLEYDGQPMVMYDDYVYPSGETFEISHFSFYISELTFSSDNSEYVDELPAFIDLTMHNNTLEKSEKGYDFIINGVTPSDYDSFSFNLGLTPELNSTLPSEYSSGHPLAMTSEYWSAWMSYIFVKIEGNIDLDDNGSLERGIALHMGSDAAMRNVEYEINGSDELEIIIDLKDIFEGDQLYDIRNTPAIHNLSQIDQINELMDNFQLSIQD